MMEAAFYHQQFDPLEHYMPFYLSQTFFRQYHVLVYTVDNQVVWLHVGSGSGILPPMSNLNPQGTYGRLK